MAPSGGQGPNLRLPISTADTDYIDCESDQFIMDALVILNLFLTVKGYIVILWFTP